MPFLKIQTNIIIDQPKKSALLDKASKQVSEILGKSENYVMVSLEHNPCMLFSGSDKPLAFLELKSIGLPEDATRQYSASLTDMVSNELGIDKDRIYIEFAKAERHLWGWNGGTF